MGDSDHCDDVNDKIFTFRERPRSGSKKSSKLETQDFQSKAVKSPYTQVLVDKVRQTYPDFQPFSEFLNNNYFGGFKGKGSKDSNEKDLPATNLPELSKIYFDQQ